MRRTLLVLVAFLVAALPSWAAAQALLVHAPGPYTSPAAIGNSETQLIEGKILRLDDSRTTATLANGTTLTIPDSATVSPSRRLLQSGDRILATYHQEGWQKVASFIQIKGISNTG